MIEIRNLCKSYEGKVIYDNWNMTLKSGQTTFFMGPSGIGKTTLLRILAGLEAYEKGEIIGINGLKVAYVFSEDRLMPWLNVRENIEYVLRSWMPKKACEAQSLKMLEMMSLTDEIEARLHALSSGMKRRVALARGLAYNSDLLLLDEPFTGLDDELKEEIIKRMKVYFEANGTTVIGVTHDLEEAKSLGEIIDLGKIQKKGRD